jgi:hypothetical protein
MNTKARWLSLAVLLVPAWAFYAYTVIQHSRDFEAMDPYPGIEASFASVYLWKFGGAALLLMTILAVVVVLVLNARSRGAQGPAHPYQSTPK